AVFVEIRGAHQYMRLYLTGQRDLNSVKLRADEAMSLCLHLSVPIYATKSFIGRSRVMNAEIENGQSPQIMQGFGVEKPEYLN
ncbi:MAG TPA: hypothetical protein VN132_02540, partial [Bdellovibrio sp.]|nr:hypothetical protein [Bdellovibrio sp.]